VSSWLCPALALVSTGIATVALALLSYNLAGDDAGAVLGTAFAIKMLAYLGNPPIAVAFVERMRAGPCSSASTWCAPRSSSSCPS
jgi:hypothetical protein